ncbi:MAG: tellurite resistance TerB family protein [Parvibaculales bacterium]
MREDTLFTTEQVLVFLMLTMAAADGPLNDTETARIARLVAVLPVFENLPDKQIPDIIDHFAALMSDEAGLDTLMELVGESVPPALYETAYALAVEVAAADYDVQPEEIRLLELIRDTLKLEKLVTAAIERGARARFTQMPH